MVIYTNTASSMILGETNKNSNKLEKSLKKVSSGMKLNSAGDDAAAYSISEKMRVQIRSLNQDEANVRTGRNLVAVAEGGIQEIVNNIRTMRELAINALNDTNTDKDREILDKVYQQHLTAIDEIAYHTEYNGRKLLVGHVSESDGSSGGASKYTFSGQSTIPGVMPPRSKSVPTGSAQTCPHRITKDGVYELPAGFTGDLTIEAQNVKLIQNCSTLKNVHIECANPGADLWISGLDIKNDAKGADAMKSIITFNGNDNQLHVQNDNQLIKSDCAAPAAAAIYVGDGLTIIGEGEDNSLWVDNNYTHYSSCIGINTSEVKPDTYITILNVDKLHAVGCYGAAIGSAGDNGAKSVIGPITIIGGNVEAIGTGDKTASTIGCGRDGFSGDIFIAVDSLDVYCWDGNHIIQEDRHYGGAISTGIDGTHNITIDSGDIYIRGDKVSAIASQATTNAGATVVTTINGSDYRSPQHVYEDKSPSKAQEYAATLLGVEWGKGPLEHIDPIIIHTGTKSSQHMEVFINDMDCKHLGLEGTSISTWDKAYKCLKDSSQKVTDNIIDKALKKALDNATRMGAYQSRLEFTEDTIVTASENTNAAESVIRDSDMAKEMTEYAKNNVLLQAAQSMLAQSNKSAETALSLLQ